MLNQERLATAIEIQSKSYRLLLWIADALEAGSIQPHFAAQHSNDPAAARQWIHEFFNAIPTEIQPGPGQMEEFANFFWTYIVTSFEVDVQPGMRGQGGTEFCSCDLCVKLVSAPHLRPKKLRTADKRRALVLMKERLQSLASEHEIELSGSDASLLAESETNRRNAGYSAYGEWLIERLAANTDGPSILCLWREIAWHRSGSPRKDFSLQIEDFNIAEAELLNAIKNSL